MEPVARVFQCVCYRWSMYGFNQYSKSIPDFHGYYRAGGKPCDGRIKKRKRLGKYKWQSKEIIFYKSLCAMAHFALVRENKKRTMDRRELLKMIAVLTGGVVVGAEAFLTGCKNVETVGTEFTPKNIAFLDEVAETILPATNTPGAKAANVGQFMTGIVNDCYDEDDQKTFHDGMKQLNDAFDKK